MHLVQCIGVHFVLYSIKFILCSDQKQSTSFTGHWPTLHWSVAKGALHRAQIRAKCAFELIQLLEHCSLFSDYQPLLPGTVYQNTLVSRKHCTANHVQSHFVTLCHILLHSTKVCHIWSHSMLLQFVTFITLYLTKYSTLESSSRLSLVMDSGHNNGKVKIVSYVLPAQIC